jgi:hypothetical protein
MVEGATQETAFLSSRISRMALKKEPPSPSEYSVVAIKKSLPLLQKD